MFDVLYTLSLNNFCSIYSAQGMLSDPTFARDINFVQELWIHRYGGTIKSYQETLNSSNDSRKVCHYVVQAVSNSVKMQRKIAKEKVHMLALIESRKKSIIHIKCLMESINNKITSNQLTYMWNVVEHREVLDHLSIKWEDMALQAFFEEFPDGDPYDNDSSFDEKYGRSKSDLSVICMQSLPFAFDKLKTLKKSNQTLLDQVHNLEREERKMSRSISDRSISLTTYSTSTVYFSIPAQHRNRSFRLIHNY